LANLQFVLAGGQAAMFLMRMLVVPSRGQPLDAVVNVLWPILGTP
jgi:hypothetical protein